LLFSGVGFASPKARSARFADYPEICERSAAMPLVLSCYVERRDHWWEAVCPNLNFSARGNSEVQAYERLGSQLQEYVAYVETFPPEARAALYRRQPPFYARLGRIILLALAGPPLRSRAERRRYRIPYTFSCNASL
jgi:hypothetical protein